MSTAPEGEHRKSAAFIATFNYIAVDEKADLNFRYLMENAFKMAVNSVLKLFGDDIEIVDPAPELPTTEVVDRGEV
jgi:hypothetical protein